MKSKTRMFALAAVMLLAATSIAGIVTSLDDSSADSTYTLTKGVPVGMYSAGFFQAEADYTITSGAIPPGMAVSQYVNEEYEYVYYLSGTPNTAGTFSATFRYRSTDGSTWMNTTMTWNVIVPSIPYTAPSNLTPLVGSNWVYTPTSDTGATVSVSGASWLSASGNTIYGVPPAAGSYNVTVTLMKAGHTTSTHSFTLTVSSVLVPTNSPTNGAIIMPK